MEMTLRQLEDALGALLIGSVVAFILYGVTCVQTFIYSQKKHNDGRLAKFMIFILWVLDTVHITFITHCIYYYVITNFTNPLAFTAPTWSMVAQIFVSSASNMIVRSFFARRLWILSNRNKLILFLIALSSLVELGATTAFASIAINSNFTQLNSRTISALIYTAIASGVAADGLIAVCLCVQLASSRTGDPTDSVLSSLMAYTVNTGLITSVWLLIIVITYAACSGVFVFVGVHFSLSKVYLNALLAGLNARDAMRARVAAATPHSARAPTPYSMRTLSPELDWMRGEPLHMQVPGPALRPVRDEASVGSVLDIRKYAEEVQAV